MNPVLGTVGNAIGTAMAPAVSLTTQALQGLSSAAQPVNNTAATPPPIVGLAKPPVTATAPTGVATSSAANDTLNTQKQSTDNLTNTVAQHAANKQATPTFNPEVSIVDLLSSKGQPNDFASRAKLAQQAGIKDYVGTADQNAQLIGYVNNPPATTTGTSTTQTGTTGTTGTQTGSTSTTGTPAQPATGSTGDVYSPAILQAQNDISSALEQRNQQVQQIMNGTFPLTGYQQTLLDATRNQFNVIAQLQMTANKSYEGGVALAGQRLGTNLTNPQEYLAEQQQAVTDGLIKVNTLDATAAKTLADLQQGFMDKDYTYINDSYTALAKTLEDKATALKDLQTRTDSLYTSTRDYNEKVSEFAKSQAQQKAEFNQTQALERAKFTAQYAGLIDPNTGLFKPTADPTTLPGVVSLPPEIGTGVAGHYIDLGQIADKNLATMIGQQGRISGMGVVDTTQNKTFNQSLSALSGLDSLIKSGAVDPNAKVTDVIGNKKSASLVLRAFGSTQPDNIAQVLGAGGASVPNLDTMTMGQAANFLKNSVYTAMGTNTTAQRYAMNPSLASTDLQTYYQSSPINALAVEKSYSSFPNLTPSQRMQLLNPQ